MSLEEEPIIVSVVAIEETSFVVDVVTPPVVPAVDVTVIYPVASIVVDVPGIEVTSIEVTNFVVDIAVPPALAAIDVTIGDPAATIIVDIPGSGGGGENDVVISDTEPSPTVDLWLDTSVTAPASGAWVQMTQAAYDALPTKDPNTLYLIVD